MATTTIVLKIIGMNDDVNNLINEPLNENSKN